MKVREHFSLKYLNTFGINVTTRYFAEAGSATELKESLADKQFAGMPLLILGGGSNILFTGDYSGRVLKINIRGIEPAGEDGEHYFVRAGAGEEWHGFVQYCIKNNYQGVENLSLIPGTVGATPIQNIGAYGVEIKDVFMELEAMEVSSGSIRKFSMEECRFGYRDSVFKNELKGKYIITSVTFALNKQHALNTSYGDIEKEMESMGIAKPSAVAVSEAVCRIRKRKLADPAICGNAGSFFKNPVISKDYFALLKRNFPDIPGYVSGIDNIKIAAGWLIEKCGWKGKTLGKCGVHKDHALVIVNYGGATGMEIFELSEKIIKSVTDRFGIDLEREVNII